MEKTNIEAFKIELFKRKEQQNNIEKGEKMEDIRSNREITTKILELEKELGYRYNRYTEHTKELIQTKIDTLNWVLKRTERL